MKEDPRTRAENLEAVCEWEKAAKLWEKLAARGDDEARERHARARQALTMIESLCVLANEALAREDLREAREPIEAASELAPDGHRRVKHVRKRWREVRARAMRARGGASLLRTALSALAGAAAVVALTLCMPEMEDETIGLFAGLALGTFLAAAFGTFRAITAFGWREIPVIQAWRKKKRLRPGQVPKASSASWRAAQRALSCPDSNILGSGCGGG